MNRIIKVFLTIIFSAIIYVSDAQSIAINTTGSLADTSAILDIAHTAKGVLIPRMTAAQRAAIFTPATGLLVYQTDGTAGFYYNNGTSAAPAWLLIQNSSAANISGTLTTAAQPNITSLGTLSSLTVSGIITGGTFSGTLSSGTIAGINTLTNLTSLTVGGPLTATSVGGVLTTATQPAITSVGSLSGLTVSGNLRVTGDLFGTLTTATQPNITSLGTITGLTVSGKVNTLNLSVTGSQPLLTLCLTILIQPVLFLLGA
jgi:hypothetical protein